MSRDVILERLKKIDDLEKKAWQIVDEMNNSSKEDKWDYPIILEIYWLFDFVKYRINCTEENYLQLVDATDDLGKVIHGGMELDCWIEKWKPVSIELGGRVSDEYGTVRFDIEKMPECDFDCEACEFAIIQEDKQLCFENKMNEFRSMDDEETLVDLDELCETLEDRICYPEDDSYIKYCKKVCESYEQYCVQDESFD